MKSLQQHKSLIKFIVVSVVFSILLTLSLSLSAYAAPCPPTCNEAELATLAATNPQQAYNINPELAIKATGGKVLVNHDIAHDYFTKHPDKMKEYRKFAQNYFMTKGKINRPLMKTYLSKDVTIHDEQDLAIARKYLHDANFKDSTDRTIFRFYMRDVKAMTAQDKAIAKSFFTAENGKYINENIQNVRELFKKYLKAEGVEVVAINGPVKSFSRDGTLSGKNAKVNIYNLKEKAGFNYALKVESDGSLALSQTQFELKKKEEFKITEKAKQEKMGTSKWDALLSALSGESESEFFMRKSIEKQKQKEPAETEISEEIVTTYEPGFYPTDVKVPFEGDLELTDGGKIKLKQGKIRHVDVKGAEDVTADARSFSGKFEEVAGVEFKNPSHIKVHTVLIPDEDNPQKKIVYYNLEGEQANDGGMPIIDKIKPYTFQDYTQFSEVNGQDVPEEVKVDFQGGIDANGVILSGKYLIENYDSINPKRDIVAPAYGTSLTLNGVTIYPTEKYYTRIFFPNKPVTEDFKSENYIAFREEGVTINGAGTKALVTPQGLVRNEIAATGNTERLISFPKRGYFQIGDRDKDKDYYLPGEEDVPAGIYNKYNTPSYYPIEKIQEIVGVKEINVEAADVVVVYGQKTFNAVKEWQKTQKLNGRPIKVDGLFGKESFMAYLQSEGDIFLSTSTNSNYNQGKVSYQEGKIKIDTQGDIESIRVGAKEYVVKTSKKGINDQQLALGEAAPSDIKSDINIQATDGAVIEHQLNQVPGLNPFFAAKDLGIPYELNVDELSADAGIQSGLYVQDPNLLKYYQFDRQAVYSQTGNFIDTLVNPELVKEGVEINPEFQDMVKDGKLRVVYLAGKGDEGKRVLDHDTNVLHTAAKGLEEPTQTPPPETYTKVYTTKDGKPIDVEVVVVWNQKQVDEELKKEGTDVFHISGHSRSIEKQGIFLGKGRSILDTKSLASRSKEYKRPQLISVRSCISTKRVVPGLKTMFKQAQGPQTTYLAAVHKPGADIGTTLLGGLLTGKSLKDIKDIANLENQEGDMFTIIPEQGTSQLSQSSKKPKKETEQIPAATVAANNDD